MTQDNIREILHQMWKLAEIIREEIPYNDTIESEMISALLSHLWAAMRIYDMTIKED